MKACVPPHYRQWNRDGEFWIFDLSCYELIVAITEDSFGSMMLDLVGEINVPQFSGWEQKWQTYKTRRESASANTEDWRSLWEDLFGQHTWTGGGQAPPMPGRGGNAYQELFVQSNAPWEVIEAAYRALAKLHHPDRGGDTARMQGINAAYDKIKQLRGK
jgi:hypothetical protein